MRRPAFILCSAIVIAAAAASAVPSASTQAPATTATRDLIDRARTAVGGAKALNAVHALRFDTTTSTPNSPPYTLTNTLLLPNKYASASKTATFTLVGDTYWGSGTAIAAGSQAAALTMRRQLLRWIAVMLIPKSDTVVPGLTVAVKENVDMPDGKGVADVLKYSGPDMFLLDLFLDPKSGRPIGYTWPYWRDVPSSTGFLSRFTKFETVQGVAIPVEADVVTQGNDGKMYHTRLTIDKISVNPAGAEAQFVRR